MKCQVINIEVWDFWKISHHMDMLMQKAGELAHAVRVIYHAERKTSEFLKISLLEQAVRKSGIPFELSVVFLDTATEQTAPVKGYRWY